MTLPHPYTGNETKAEQPLDQDLMDLKVRENIESLSAQIDAIGGGGAGGALDTGAIGKILLGGETNEPRYWKRRFHPIQHMLSPDSSNPSGFDPEGRSIKNEMITFIQSNVGNLTLNSLGPEYLNRWLVAPKDEKLSFKIKKGVNFFSIGNWYTSSRTDRVEVYIDGQTPSSLGLTDENGDAAPDFFSTNSATTFYQVPTFFYGLDGEEHIIDLVNNDSGANSMYIDFVEIGYRSVNPTIDETAHINAGIANVRGTEISFNDSDLTFGNLNKNGHTAAIKINDAGALSVLDGESPAMTQVKAEEAIAFSAPVTSLPVKNNFYFPDNGIVLVSTPYGNHHLASYTSKTIATIQTHSFDNMLWQSQPTEDYTPLVGFTGSTGAAFGDININYWGTAPILIDSSNNKIDFEITIGGVTTVHAATVASGRYAADLVPLENAVRKAMQTAKPINGEYHLKYNPDSQLWNIYIKGNEIESFTLLFATGLNVANSIHATIGFSGDDKSGALSYLASNELQHLCCRVLEADAVYMHSEDPRIKYSVTDTSAGSITPVEADILERLNLGSARYLSSGPQIVQVFPDEDCTGLQADFITNNNGSMIVYQIDDGELLYLTQNDMSWASTATRGRMLSSLISFPRGSRKITLRIQTGAAFQLDSDVEIMLFAGCRQYFTKPATEKLSKTEAIIKTFDISPLSLYATVYGHNGGTLYSPAAQDDQINTISEVGSWSGSGDASSFNNARRFSNTIGDYVEIDFTLIGNGGGIAMKNKLQGTATSKFQLFLSSSAINEVTDLITNTHHNWDATLYDQDSIGSLGLPAGTYKARFKIAGGGTNGISNLGIVVYDTVSPQENANTVTDINNTGQSVSYPIHVRRDAIMRDSSDRVPSWLERSGYKEGRITKVNYSFNVANFVNNDDEAQLVVRSDQYYGHRANDAAIGSFVTFSNFVKSFGRVTQSETTFSPTHSAFIDGVQMLNNHSFKNQVKGGGAPSATRYSSGRLAVKEFKLSCSLNAGLIYNISDTRGFKNNISIILDDGTNKEKVVVDSFVVGTSFTIKKAPTLVIPANVIAVEFQGFHTLKTVSNDAANGYMTSFEYEPLTISPSKAIQRMSTEFKYEKVSITHRGIPSGGDAYYPVHSDGIIGNWTTSTIEVIGANGADYRLDQDLKNITTTGDLDLKISSERLIPVLNESERF